MGYPLHEWQCNMGLNLSRNGKVSSNLATLTKMRAISTESLVGETYFKTEVYWSNENTKPCITWKRKIRINWNFGKNQHFFFTSSDSWHKMMLLESLIFSLKWNCHYSFQKPVWSTSFLTKMGRSLLYVKWQDFRDTDTRKNHLNWVKRETWEMHNENITKNIWENHCFSHLSA